MPDKDIKRMVLIGVSEVQKIPYGQAGKELLSFKAVDENSLERTYKTFRNSLYEFITNRAKLVLSTLSGLSDKQKKVIKDDSKRNVNRIDKSLVFQLFLRNEGFDESEE